MCEMVASSDQSLLVRKCDALSLFHRLEGSMLDGVRGLSPGRESVMIRFDARVLDHETVESWVRRTGGMDGGASRFDGGRLVEIPTIYDGEDLEGLAASQGLHTKEVVDIHSGCEYLAWFLGFVPGFAYLGEVPDAIAVPRRATPRKAVPPGSVGVAGKQTGVYPRSTPGGWNLIGRTALEMFDWNTGRSLIEPGDRVRFVPL